MKVDRPTLMMTIMFILTATLALTISENDGELGWPMLESPVARETQGGRVSVGEAVLTCGEGAGWLFACPETKRWVAAYHGLDPAPLTLSVPGGTVEVEATAAPAPTALLKGPANAVLLTVIVKLSAPVTVGV